LHPTQGTTPSEQQPDKPDKMKTQSYCKFFQSKDGAMQFMRLQNRAAASAGNRRDVLCVTDGPCDNFAVVDLKTAIELGNGYSWEA
jgi:hypothetical protein